MARNDDLRIRKNSTMTQGLAMSLWDYCPETGQLTWKISPARSVQAGSVAGKPSFGYVLIGYKGFLYMAHRLAWLYCHGAFPKKFLDHIDGDRANNRIANLREATSAENGQNRRLQSNNTSGYPGVFKHHGKWVARIKVDGKTHHLGTFKSAEQGHVAYIEAKARLHTFNPTLLSRLREKGYGD